MQCGRPRFDPWVGKIPWRRAWHPTAVFLPGESRGQRSLAGCGPCVCKEWNTTEQQQTGLRSLVFPLKCKSSTKEESSLLSTGLAPFQTTFEQLLSGLSVRPAEECRLCCVSRGALWAS